MKTRTRNIVLAAVFAALIFIVTAYLPRLAIPGGYIHFGDAFIYIAACLLPTPYAIAAAAVGASLADILTGFAIWAPATLIIKAVMAALFSSRSEKLLTVRNLLASFGAAAVCILGYYVYEALIISDFAIALESIAFNLIQGAGSSAIFAAVAFALDRIHIKKYLQSTRKE